MVRIFRLNSVGVFEVKRETFAKFLAGNDHQNDQKKLSKNTKWHSLWLRQPGDLGHARLKSEHEMWPSLPPGSGDQEIRGLNNNVYLLRELLTPPPVQGLLTAVAAVRCIPFPSETLKKYFKKQD